MRKPSRMHHGRRRKPVNPFQGLSACKLISMRRLLSPCGKQHRLQGGPCRMGFDMEKEGKRYV